MKVILLIFFTAFVQINFAQYDLDNLKNDSTKNDNKFNWFEQQQKIYVGGEVNFAFQSGATFLYLSPLIGYDITKRFSGGISTIYQLLRYRDPNGTYNLNTFGGGVFARYRPIEQVLLQTEFNVYNTVDFTMNPFEDRVMVPSFMAGLGYANSMGDRAYYQMMLMYDFINDPNMPISSIIIPQLHLKLGLVWYLG